MSGNRAWPVAIVAVLALTVGAYAVLMYVARDPNALVVEPDYYRKAITWDSTMARARESVALGWQLDAALDAWKPGGTALRVKIADSTGAPVTGAVVRIDLINNVRPEDVLHAVPADAGGGLYRANVALPRPGLWEVRAEARRGHEWFSADLRREAAGGAPR